MGILDSLLKRGGVTNEMRSGVRGIMTDIGRGADVTDIARGAVSTVLTGQARELDDPLLRQGARAVLHAEKTDRSQGIRERTAEARREEREAAHDERVAQRAQARPEQSDTAAAVATTNNDFRPTVAQATDFYTHVAEPLTHSRDPFANNQELASVVADPRYMTMINTYFDSIPRSERTQEVRDIRDRLAELHEEARGHLPASPNAGLTASTDAYYDGLLNNRTLTAAAPVESPPPESAPPELAPAGGAVLTRAVYTPPAEAEAPQVGTSTLTVQAGQSMRDLIDEKFPDNNFTQDQRERLVDHIAHLNPEITDVNKLSINQSVVMPDSPTVPDSVPRQDWDAIHAQYARLAPDADAGPTLPVPVSSELEGQTFGGFNRNRTFDI